MYFKDLGYDSYDEYLNGVEWGQIRDIFYKNSGKYRCRICHAKKQLIVHKRTYYYLQPEFFKQMDKAWLNKILVYLCDKHNREVHFYDRRQKVPLDYLFLAEREHEIYKRPINVFWRLYRDLGDVWIWIRESYYPHKLKRRRTL